MPKEKGIKKPTKSGLGMIYIRSTLFGEDGNFPDLGACASRVAQATLFSHESRHLAFRKGRDECDDLDLHHKIYCEDMQIAADLAADIKAKNGCEPGFDEWLNNTALPTFQKQKDKLLCLFEICKGAKSCSTVKRSLIMAR